MYYYFDTNALLKYYDINGNELGVENVRSLVESEKQVLISELTILTRVRDNRTLISLKSMSYKFKIRI
jgi:hypothetical protein